MLEETRLHRIRALLSTLNRISTEQLIQHLNVSRETVRRDIVKLENLGELRRVHGGVVALGAEPEPPLSVRATVRGKEKQAIARAAVQQLRAGQTIFIDAGSTTSVVADELVSMPGMTIITNSLSVASRLTESEYARSLNHEVILLGGEMGPVTQATCGVMTIRELQRFRADVALLSPVGIASQSGASSFTHHEAAIAEAMIGNANKRIILADHSKIGVTSRMVYARIADIDMIISDEAASSRDDWAALQASCEEAIAV